MGDPANTMDIPANTFVSPDGRFSFRYPEFKGWTHSFFLSPAQNLHLTITFHPVKLTPDDIAPQIYLTGDGIDDSRLVAGSDGYDKKAVSSFLENRAIYII